MWGMNRWQGWPLNVELFSAQVQCPSALPTKTKVGIETSQNKSGTCVNLSNNEFWAQVQGLYWDMYRQRPSEAAAGTLPSWGLWTVVAPMRLRHAYSSRMAIVQGVGWSIRNRIRCSAQAQGLYWDMYRQRPSEAAAGLAAQSRQSGLDSGAMF